MSLSALPPSATNSTNNGCSIDAMNVTVPLLVCAILLSGCSTHTGRPDTPKLPTRDPVDVTIVHDIVYTPANWPQPLAADLYQPEGVGPFPGVVMIHGGGWQRRTRDDMSSISHTVARRGYVVMNVSYRFAPRWHFPAQLQDVQQALLWLRTNAPDHHVRPDRIGAWGYSSGAHLAALVGATGPGDEEFVERARIQAVVGGGTPVDMRYYPDGPLVRALMEVSLDENPEVWREASPIALVTADDPPMFLYHGTFDLTVGDNNAHAMYAALSAAGVPAELYLVRGHGHISTFLLDSPIESGIEFLERHLR